MAAKSHSKIDTIEVNKIFFYTFYIIAMVFTPMYIYQIYKLVIMFDTKDLMAEVRELAVHGEGFGILGYTFVINEAMLLVAMWRYPKIPLWQLITIIIANIMYAFGNMEKTTFFLVFTSTIFVLYEKGKIKLRSILIGSGVILVLFYIFNIARSGEDTEYAKNESLLDFIGMYILAAPVAYGRLQETISDMFGPNSLYTFHYFYNKFFGGGNVPYQQFQDFVYVPISTNVYTLLRPYYTDFGHMGIVAFAAIYGVTTGFAYRLMKNGNAFGTCLYTYFVYVLILQFFDDFITVSLSQFSHLLILLTLITQQSFRLSVNRK
jgi:oligosaccharide repeat unit polymerase